MTTLVHLQTIQDLINDFSESTGFVLNLNFEDNQLVFTGRDFKYVSANLDDAETFAWGLLNGSKIQGGRDV